MAVDDLAALELQHVAWLLVIEGVPWAYTTQSALAGSGASSWIGTDEGQRVVRSGLLPPDSLSTAIKIGVGDDTGMLEDDGAEFRVIAPAAAAAPAR